MPFRLVLCSLALLAAKPTFADATDIATRAEKVSDAQLARIRAGLKHGATLAGPVACVKSGAHANAYYVGAVLNIPVSRTKKEQHAAVWLIGGTRESPNLTYAAEGFAEQFSDWPALKKTKAWAGNDEDIGRLQAHIKTMGE